MCFFTYQLPTHISVDHDKEDSLMPSLLCLALSLIIGCKCICTFHPQVFMEVNSGCSGVRAIGVEGASWLEAGGEGVALTKFILRGTLEIK